MDLGFKDRILNRSFPKVLQGYKINEIRMTLNVYFSICFFSKQMINTYLMLEIRVACREFLAFKYIFFETKQMIIYFCTSEILKTRD